jgi:GWxTD domain-containing protein
MMNTSIFKLLLCLSLFLGMSLGVSAQEKLNMHLDYNRFLDHEGNTILLIDYQIPYRSLIFLAHSGAYFAEVEVEIQIANQDSLIYARNVTDNIGISSKYDASSNNKSYLNRITLLMNEPWYQVSFSAQDLNSGSVFDWEFEVRSLPPDTRISDLELNGRVYADSSAVLQKFRRQQMVYEPIPSIIFNRSYLEYAHLYLELYTPEEELGRSQLLMLSLERDQELILDEYIDTTPNQSSESIALKVPLADLKAGKYQGSVSLQADDTLQSRSFEFVLSDEAETMYSLFPDPDDEYTLMRYFMASRAPSNWTAMNEESKRQHINNFWRSMALSTRMDVNDIMDLVHERIEYANKNFSSLKPGWTSDMGRIYIRNGAPADIESGTTSDETRFVRKDYQIWKYQSGNRPVYVFIDQQMNNNFRLIYVTNDDMEITNPDWLRFLGTDFDESLLRN